MITKTVYYIDAEGKEFFDPRGKWTCDADPVNTLAEAKELLAEAIADARAKNYCEEFINSIHILPTLLDEVQHA